MGVVVDYYLTRCSVRGVALRVSMASAPCRHSWKIIGVDGAAAQRLGVMWENAANENFSENLELLQQLLQQSGNYGVTYYVPTGHTHAHRRTSANAKIPETHSETWDAIMTRAQLLYSQLFFTVH